jgi:acyl carrier protein
MNVIEKVEEFLVEHNYAKNFEIINSTDSLTENGYIDSIGIRRLIIFLENEYNFAVSDEDLEPENFDSLKAIENYVRSKTSQ